MQTNTFDFCGYEKIIEQPDGRHHMDTTFILSTEAHSHTKTFEMFFVKRGQCTIEVSAIKHELYMNDILIVPPNILHFTQALSDDAVVACHPFVMLENSKRDDLINMVSPCLKVVASPLIISLWDCLDLSDSNKPIYTKRKEIVSNLLFAELVTLVTEKVERFAQIEDSKTKSYIEIIDGFFSNPDNYSLTSEDLADLLHISPRHLNRLLIQHFGDNFGNILCARRLFFAKWMLRSTKLSVDEISVKVGFISPSAFFKFFKKHVGMTPKKYRDSILKLKKPKNEENQS